MDSNHKQAEKRAAEWLCRRDSADWSESDQASLDDWLNESSAHAVAFIRLDSAWNRADRYKALGAGFPSRRVPTPDELSRSPFFDETTRGSQNAARGAATSILQELIHEEPVPLPGASVPKTLQRHPHVLFRLAWAASIALVLVAGLAWRLGVSSSSYRTPIGGMASVPMRDGSRVTLNTDSAVRLAVTDTERSVELNRGEAFFEVAKDPNRPFVVNAGSKRIIVVGTQFSVRRDGDDVRVVVTEGKVRIEDANPSRGGPGSATGEAGAFVLEAGGVARTGEAGVLVQSKPLSDVQEALSWRAGFLIFRDVNLAEAVAEFNRYNEKKMTIQDPVVAAIRLNGKFKAHNFDAFVRLLKDGFPIDAHDSEGSIVLTEREN
jgi:transmembrane sensor